jgi:NhaA family Na+:H+ antiporter
MEMHHQDQFVAEEQRLLQRFLAPLVDFARLQSAGGILLLLCTIVALVWANSPWREVYQHLLHMKLGLSFDKYILDQPLEFWINDGLMTVFFFVVGLEIKRELLVGELRSPRRALLPIAAALGGMIVPALLYLQFNPGGPGHAGWGIPMATDIAFAIGILALVGRGAPASITVLLTALAIVDDLGAVVVIALFYTNQINMAALITAGIIWLVMLACNFLGLRSPFAYSAFAIGLWLFFLSSGVHATISGVLAAAAIPTRSMIPPANFAEVGMRMLRRFQEIGESIHLPERVLFGRRIKYGIFQNAEQVAIIEALETGCERVQSPLQRLEHGLHATVAFLVMPVFALANAGVALGGDLLDAYRQPVTLGVIAGLFLGKPLGIFLFSWLSVKLKLCDLPAGANWLQVLAVGCLGGIGFTMSLFVTNLAFRDAALVNQSKQAILTASLLAALAGAIVLRLAAPKRESASPLPDAPATEA